MGRRTFEPALGAERWPWPDLSVFVLGSRRPEGTPEQVVSEGDPKRRLPSRSVGPGSSRLKGEA
jgi:hypothetical protein